MQTPSKRCCRCKTDQDVSEFCRDRQTRDGLSARCRSCRRELNREQYAKNPAPRREARMRYYVANKELEAERHRMWREANPGWSAVNNRKWREANPAAASAYHAANRDKSRARWLRREALKRSATVGDVDLEALWVANVGQCQLCGDSIDRTLDAPHSMSASVDHIVPLSKGGTHEQANLQWAHLMCNKKKGARLPAQPLLQGA